MWKCRKLTNSGHPAISSAVEKGDVGGEERKEPPNPQPPDESNDKRKYETRYLT